MLDAIRLPVTDPTALAAQITADSKTLLDDSPNGSSPV